MEVSSLRQERHPGERTVSARGFRHRRAGGHPLDDERIPRAHQRQLFSPHRLGPAGAAEHGRMDDLRPGQRQRRTARLHGDQWRTDPTGRPRQLHQWLPARDVPGIDHQAECHGAGQCEAAGDVGAAATGEARPRPSSRPGFRRESGGRGKSARRAGKRHRQSGARLSDADGGAGPARPVRRIGGNETGLRARGRVQADADFRHRVPAGPPDGGAGSAVRGAHLPIDQCRSLGSAQQAPRGACQQREGGRPAHRGPDPGSQGPWDARLHTRGLER